MNNVRVIVSFELKKEDIDFSIEYLKEFVRLTNNNPGCIISEFWRDNANENHFYFIELWKDKNAVIEHVQSDYFKEYAPFFAYNFDDLHVRQMTTIPISTINPLK